MINIPRAILPAIESRLFNGKPIFLYGARQTGKSALLHMLLQRFDAQQVLYFDGDQPGVRADLARADYTALRLLIGERSLLIIDEAQRIKGIAGLLAILSESFPGLQVIACGSLALFDLVENAAPAVPAERFYVYPFSSGELFPQEGEADWLSALEHRLRFGLYPGIVEHNDPAAALLALINEGLYRDVVETCDVKNPDILYALLQLLAVRIGEDISYNDLGRKLNLDKVTAARYVGLLERAGLVFHIDPFARQLEKEVAKYRRIYFVDLGIRNALLNNFNPPAMRADAEALWENFFISERLKFHHNRRRYPGTYYWRTYDGAGLDFLEKDGEDLRAFECQWIEKKWRPPAAFGRAYPTCEPELVARRNVLQFLT